MKSRTRDGQAGNLLLALAALSMVGCGGGDAQDKQDGGSEPETRASQKGDFPRGLDGTLIFERNDPGQRAQVMRLDFDRKRFELAADGFDASFGDDLMAYLELCSPLAVRLSVTDSDGFSSPVSPCFELDTITPDFYSPSVSPDDRFIAVANTAIPLPKDELPDTAAARYGIGDNTYSATQIYRPDGSLVAELRGFDVSAWTRRNELIVAGNGGDHGFGLFRANQQFNKTERVDDGRIKGNVLSIDAHPKKDRVVFIYNGQIFEMDLKSGSPRRIHSHGFPLASVAYSPDGDAVVFVSSDPLQEAFETPNTGYNMYLLRDDDIERITVPFVPGGPLDWVD